MLHLNCKEKFVQSCADTNFSKSTHIWGTRSNFISETTFGNITILGFQGYHFSPCVKTQREIWTRFCEGLCFWKGTLLSTLCLRKLYVRYLLLGLLYISQHSVFFTLETSIWSGMTSTFESCISKLKWIIQNWQKNKVTIVGFEGSQIVLEPC